MNQIKGYIRACGGRLIMGGAIATISLCIWLSGSFGHLPSALAANLPATQTLLAYNIDMGMDEARGEKTIEYHGEDLREIVEQTLRNNVNHPESKDTAKNSYKRESALNNILPEKRSSAFSKKELSKLRETKHPKDILK